MSLSSTEPSIQFWLISPLSHICLIADNSTLRRWSKTCLVMCAVLCRDLLSVHTIVRLSEGSTILLRMEFKKNALSQASDRDSVSADRVDCTICLILDEFHDRGAVFLFLSHGNICSLWLPLSLRLLKLAFENTRIFRELTSIVGYLT